MQENKGKRITKIREYLGYKKGEFSKLLGFANHQRLYEIEKGDINVSENVLRKLNEDFGMSVAYIVFGKGTMVEDVNKAESMKKEAVELREQNVKGVSEDAMPYGVKEPESTFTIIERMEKDLAEIKNRLKL